MKFSSSYQLKILEKRQLELQVNKYVLDGAEKYLAEIDKLFDKLVISKKYGLKRKS